MEYSFDVDEAVAYGQEEAVVLRHLKFWIIKNKSCRRHYIDGVFWTYNTVKGFAEIFPFWTEKQIRRILISLKDQGVLLTGNHNKSPYDRTTWYALSPDIFPEYSIFPDDGNEAQNQDSSSFPNGNLDDPSCEALNFPNGKMNFNDRENGFQQKGEPIPDKNTDRNTDIKEKIYKKENSQQTKNRQIHFDEFWRHYPKKVGRKACEKKWVSKKLDKIGSLIIADVVKRSQEDVKWQDGYIPNPLTYLNGERWEDEIQIRRPGAKTMSQRIDDAIRSDDFLQYRPILN